MKTFARLKKQIEQIDPSRPGWRILFAVLGTILFRFPFFSFQIGVANLQNKTLWQDDFGIPCISDCRVYGELAVGIDRVGHFRWTNFPVWPGVIGWFRNLVSPGWSGYSAAVVLSWIMGVIAGVLCLWFFDRLWKGEPKVLGFAKKAWTLLLILSIYPHGHFWFQGYSEPLFVIVLMCGMLAVQSGQLEVGGLLIGLSATVRPQGVWLVPIWCLYMLWLARKGKLPWSRAVLAGALSGIGGLGLLYWYWKSSGDPFIYYTIAKRPEYARSFNLWQGIWSHHPRWDTAVLYLYLSLAGSVQMIKARDNPSRLLGWFSLAFTEVPLFFGGFYSYARFLSVSFGLFVFLTEQARKSKFRELVIMIFFLTKLAIQVYKSGFHLWVG